MMMAFHFHHQRRMILLTLNLYPFMVTLITQDGGWSKLNMAVNSQTLQKRHRLGSWCVGALLTDLRVLSPFCSLFPHPPISTVDQSSHYLMFLLTTFRVPSEGNLYRVESACVVMKPNYAFLGPISLVLAYSW